ncbi:sugar transporter [Proteus mirabilis]|uniref:sugar transporter n=1 Tax=Proteus mirabilis TaxID=584 RepID=UPI001C2B9A7B|nr:sugar transporter [Proteus mirabilis]MBU9978440.1 sugar transporter [Proteus mirabilis]
MKLKQSACLAFMMFPALSFANNEFNSVIEDFDRYLEAQQPVDIKPEPSATISLSSTPDQRSGTVRSTVTLKEKPQQKISPKQPVVQDERQPVVRNEHRPVVATPSVPQVTLSEQCSVVSTNSNKIKSDYTHYLTPLLSFVPIKPQFTPEDLNRYYQSKSVVYNPLMLYTRKRYPGQKYQNTDNTLLDFIPNTVHSVTEIPFHFLYQFKRSLLDHKQPLFNKELLNRLASTREKYQRLYRKFTEQTALLTESLTKLQSAEEKVQQLTVELAKTQEKLAVANNLLNDDSLKQSVANLQNELAQSKKEHDTLLAQLAEKDQLLFDATEKNNVLTKQQEDFDIQAQKLNQLTTHVAQLEQQKQQLQSQYEQAQRLLTNNSAKKEIEVLQNSLTNLSAARQSLEDQLAKNKASFEATLTKNNQLIDTQRQEIAQLNSHIEKINQEQQQLNHSLVTLQQQKAQADDKLTQIPALKLELQNKVNELAELKKSLSTGEKAFDALISEKNGVIAKLEKAQAELANKYQALDIQFKESNTTIEQLKESKIANDNAYVQLEKQLAEKQSLTDKLTTQLTQTKDQLAKQDSESNQLIASLKQQQVESTAQFKQQESLLANAQKAFNEVSKQLDTQLTLTKTLEEKELKLSEQLKEKENEIKKINSERASVQKENKTLKQQLDKAMGEGQIIASQLAYAYSIIGKDNAQRNKSILSEIQKQNYVQYDDNTYFKILKQGKPVNSIAGKTVVFSMHEQLTDGTVTLNYDKAKPLILPYRQLPLPLNTFVAKAGLNGKAKIYIKPDGGYGKEGILGQVPPESMSIVTIEILDIK